jgi:uncharacterized protein YndB with AHSA1/START domain
MGTQHDRIEERIILNAPRSRVWRALTDAEEFGSWFGLKLDGPFMPGVTVTGKRVDSSVDPEFETPSDWADLDIHVDAVEPERRFSYRWHPFSHDREVDYAAEPFTRVSFELVENDGRTELTIVEAGFSALPEPRSRDAREAHAGGWPMMCDRIRRFLARGSESRAKRLAAASV